MSIIQPYNINVKTLGTFFPVDEDKALQGCNLSAYAGPPFGESVPISLYGNLEGRVQSDKPKVLNIDGDRQTDKTLDVRGFDLERCRGCSCSLDSHTPGEDFSSCLDTCKQVGIFSKYVSNKYLFPMPTSSSRSFLPIPGPLPVLDPVEFRYKDMDTEWESKRDELKAEREKLADILFEAGRVEEAGRVRDCGSDFISFEAADCGDTVARPMSCGHRLCPSCMRRTSAESAKKVEQLLWYMKYPKHWTFTFVNVPHVDKEYYQKVDKCIKDLIHRKVFTDNVDGGYFHVETAINEKDNSKHVHIHSFLDAFFIPIEELKKAWKQITKLVMGEEAFEIRYRIIDKSGRLTGDDIESVEEAIKEISKYVVKPGKFLDNPKLVNEYLEAVAGQRLMTTFGNCYQSVLFRVPLSCSSYLDMGSIPFELVQAFKAKKITLLPSVRVIVKKQGLYWIIVNGRDEYRIRDNCNKDENKRKLNVSCKVLDDDEGGLPDCFCGCNKWERKGIVSADRVFRDTKGYYRLKPSINSS